MRPAVLVLAGALLAGCSAAPAPDGMTGSVPASTAASATPDPTPSDTPVPTGPACTAEATSMDLAAQVGQLVMVGVDVGLSDAQRSVIRRNQLGSVILMGRTPGGARQVAAVAGKLDALAGEAGILIATDQEGGLVQRLQGPGFSKIPPAAEQAKLSSAELVAKAKGWGRELASAGVRLDLAPVADVVPAKFRATNQPVARLGRGYGSDPKTVSAKVAAFSKGMHAADVAVAVKHFPGLGAVTGNTDFASSVVDRTTTAKSALLRPFKDAVADGADAMMVSSARYTKIDPDHIAVFSPTVIGLLRSWGFDRVVVSDDLGAAAAVRGVPSSQRAVRFVSAGGDLALTVDVATAEAMASGLRTAAKADPDLADRVAESTARVLALKASLGLYECG